MNEMSRIAAMPADEVRTRFTSAEFLHMLECDAFDGMKAELVDGEIQLVQYAKNNHAMRQGQVVIALGAVVGADRIRVEAGVDLTSDTLLTCDVGVLAHSVTEDRLLLPEDYLLIVEIAESTLKRDLRMKREKYASAGIGAYWVVDGRHEVTHVHLAPADGDYTDVHTVRFGEPLAVPGTDATITLA